jgi:hemin uptake protein HemP
VPFAASRAVQMKFLYISIATHSHLRYPDFRTAHRPPINPTANGVAMNQPAQGATPAPRSGTGPPAATPAALSSAALLAGAREVLIRHGEETYRLKLTSSNKLILTK